MKLALNPNYQLFESKGAAFCEGTQSIWVVASINNAELPSQGGCEGQGFVYALEWGDCVKIGRTKNLQQRMKHLAHNAKNYARVELGRVAYSAPHSNYCESETKLHHFFKEKRIGDGELFRLSFDHFLRQAPNLIFSEVVSTSTPNTVDLLESFERFEWEQQGLSFERFFALIKHQGEPGFDLRSVLREIRLDKSLSESQVSERLMRLYMDKARGIAQCFAM